MLSILTNTGGPFSNLYGSVSATTIGSSDYLSITITDFSGNTWGGVSATFAQSPSVTYNMAKSLISKFEVRNINYPNGQFNDGEIYSITTPGGFNGCAYVAPDGSNVDVIYTNSTINGGPFPTLKDCTDSL